MVMTERTPGHPDAGHGGHLPAEPGNKDAPVRPDGYPGIRWRARVRDPRLLSAAAWIVLLATFGLSAATWIALAALAGYDGQVHVTGPLGTATLRLAWLLPVAVDGYVVVALVTWTSPVPTKVAEFAKKNTYAAAGISVAAQSAFHSLTAWSATGVWWRAMLAAIVGAVVPAFAALAIHMKALVRRESERAPETPAKRTPASRTVRVPAPAAPPTHIGAGSGQIPAAADTPAAISASAASDTSGGQPADRSNVTPIAGRPRRVVAAAAADTTIEALADTLANAFPGRTVGLPTALPELKRVHGSCSKDRGIAAKNLHNARIAGQVDAPPASESTDTEDDQEREPVLATATA